MTAPLIGPVPACRKCGGEMAPGIAMVSTAALWPDFPGREIVTLSPGGPGRLVACMKCTACGRSVTKEAA